MWPSDVEEDLIIEPNEIPDTDEQEVEGETQAKNKQTAVGHLHQHNVMRF